MARLIADLIGQVLANLGHDYDKRALARCARVNKEWRLQARKLLYGHVTSNNKTHLDLIARTLERFAHLRPFVQSLGLTIGDVISCDDDDIIEEEDLIRALVCMPDLKRLELMGLPEFSLEVVRAFRKLAQLEHFKLEPYYEPGEMYEHDWIGFVKAASGWKKLSSLEITLAFFPGGGPTSAKSPSKLTSLKVTGGGLSDA